jgi:rSAM/selenodomain-associated transferase 1
VRFPADVLVVMAKYPRPGVVKTRLAARFGDEEACALYTAFLQDIAARFGPRSGLVWAVDPPDADPRPIVGGAGAVIGQRGTDLAERMRNCFATLFAGGAARVVMIGADAPHLTDAIVDAAFAALASHDVALVPSADGGYCLIAMRAPVDIFSGVRMSSAHTRDDTLAQIAAGGFSLHLLAPSFDVDEPGDVGKLAELVRRGDLDLRFTSEVLERLGI